MKQATERQSSNSILTIVVDCPQAYKSARPRTLSRKLIFRRQFWRECCTTIECCISREEACSAFNVRYGRDRALDLSIPEICEQCDFSSRPGALVPCQHVPEGHMCPRLSYTVFLAIALTPRQPERGLKRACKWCQR